jgi:hypothetical protein
MIIAAFSQSASQCGSKGRKYSNTKQHMIR